MFELINAPHFLFNFFFQDIRYADYKELIIKKKLITKPQTTVITEGEKKGKVLYTIIYSSQLYTLQSKHSRAMAEKWLILQIVN